MGGGGCNSKDFGAAAYWDARYSSPSPSPSTGGGFFDCYQAYPALRPLLRACVPTSSRVLILGCGNSLLSEDMVKDGYEDIVNIDFSSVVIEQMSEKHMDIPQLTYMQLDVRDMSFFGDGSFDCIIDKGTLDAVMCGDDAPHGASKMLAEVARLMRPGGIYMLITYGAPKERLTFLNQVRCRWEVELYIMPTPGYQPKWSNGAPHATMEKVAMTADGQLPPDYVLKDPESHFIYISYKSDCYHWLWKHTPFRAIQGVSESNNEMTRMPSAGHCNYTRWHTGEGTIHCNSVASRSDGPDRAI